MENQKIKDVVITKQTTSQSIWDWEIKENTMIQKETLNELNQLLNDGKIEREEYLELIRFYTDTLADLIRNITNVSKFYHSVEEDGFSVKWRSDENKAVFRGVMHDALDGLYVAKRTIKFITGSRVVRFEYATTLTRCLYSTLEYIRDNLSKADLYIQERGGVFF